MPRWNEPELWQAVDVIHKMFFVLPKEGEKYNAHNLMLKHSVLFLATVGFQLYGIIGFIFHGYSDGLRKEIIEPLQIILTALIDELIMMIFFPFGERFRKLLENIRNMSQEVPLNVLRGYIFLNKLTWIIFYAIFAAICSVGLLSFFIDAHCEGRKLKGDKRYMCGLVNPVWYSFEIKDSSVWKFLFALYISIGSAIISSFYAATFVGFIGIGYIITLRIQDLTKQLMNIEEKNIQDLGDKFVFLVDYFFKIQEFVDEVNQTFGYCCIVIYVFIRIYTACLQYSCIVDGSVKNFAFLCVCIGLQYGWCSVGQYLEDEHQKLIYSIQNLPWYDMSPQMQRNYRLFLGCSLMPLRFRIYPLVDINNKYLLSIFQGSYSITTFLINSTSRS